MSVQPARRTSLFAAVLITTALLTSIASPAMAITSSDKQASTSCWLDAETSITRCFDTEALMLASVIEETDSWPADLVQSLGLKVARPTGLASTEYVLARLYEDSAYGGSVLAVLGPSTTWCVSNAVSDSDIGALWNDRVSSVRSYYGCATRLYTVTGYGGASASYGNASTLGCINDEASSYKVS